MRPKSGTRKIVGSGEHAMTTMQNVWNLLTSSLKEPALSALWRRVLQRVPNLILAP
jgi:hypothetical protein